MSNDYGHRGNRRKYVRVPVSRLSKIHVELNGMESAQAVLIDLSEGGALLQLNMGKETIEGKQNLFSGSIIDPFNGARYNFQSKLVWACRLKNADWLVLAGLRFTEEFHLEPRLISHVLAQQEIL